MNRVAGLLRLEVRDFEDLTRWRWVLIDEADGAEVTSHDVLLDAADWQFEAFADLHQYLGWHVAPDRQGTDDARIGAEIGEWIAARVLGPVADALARRALRHHVTVRVVVPADAAGLLLRPLELAYVNGRPLAAQNITLVLQHSAGPVPGDFSAPRDRLRVLGLFSLPEGGKALNLRRERHELTRLFERIAAAGRAADMRVVQYGVTRARLRAILEEQEGWDIVHISGHGSPGEILLETDAGAPDRITAAELAGILELARPRVQLITVSACWSGAQSARRERLLLDLPTERIATSPPSSPLPAALAAELTRRLRCAVLAMRYPVEDEFAIALSQQLYVLLARGGQPLPRAVGLALGRLTGEYPALSIATPALFGARAVGLTLAAPEHAEPQSPSSSRANVNMDGFPPQPDQFVGRTGVMTRASAALASESGIPGVVLHGMPGGGKTACALELAYGHEHAFEQLIWYKAPDQDDAAEEPVVEGALTDFALTLERHLDGFQMAHLLASADGLADFLPELIELMERRRLLLVIDNAESLLDEGGGWRDDRWGKVVAALSGHAGSGRVIVTSRRVPKGLAGWRTEPVDALTADESLLMLRDLPNLRALRDGNVKVPGLEPRVARRLAVRALELAQGHPKLLELADGQAARPGQLAALLDSGDQAWRERGRLPDGFFAARESAAEVAGDGEGGRQSRLPERLSAAEAASDDYWHVLAAWTKSAADTLEPGERDLFWLLCCLEEPDRELFAVEPTWPRLWASLGRQGQPPSLDLALAAITARGLTSSYSAHPGIAEAGRAQAGTEFRDAVDASAAEFWNALNRKTSGEASADTDTGLAVRAGLAAVPYLLRQQRWADAAAVVERSLAWAPSRATAAAMLPAIRQAASHDPRQAGVLALVLRVLTPSAAESVLRETVAAAVDAGDFRAASGVAERLVDLYMDAGHLTEALDLAQDMAGFTQKAGLGPWTQLADEIRRLEVLTAMGQAAQVLDEVTQLRAHVATLPATPGPSEMSVPWQVQERLLDAGRSAALQLGQWNDALELNSTIYASMRDRNAPAADVTRTRFNDYGPLLRLDRAGEALALLQDCLRAFQDVGDPLAVGTTLSALADTEYHRDQFESAVRLERDALRYAYLADDVNGIAVSYHNHGSYLDRGTSQLTQAVASYLTSALVTALTGAEDHYESVPAAAAGLRRLGRAAVPPVTVADLDRHLGPIPGTDLPGLVARLAPDMETANRVLRQVVTRAEESAGTASNRRKSWFRLGRRR